jgi:hypothetical protein
MPRGYAAGMRRHTLGAALCAALLLSPAHAERPMVTDDAGTLALHGKKLEFGWGREGSVRGIEIEAGYGVLEGLEVALAAARARADGGVRAHAVGLALKWVPLQPEQGLAAGLRLDIGRERGGGESAREVALTGLLSWRFANEVALHANLGQRHVRAGGVSNRSTTWAGSVDLPLAEHWQLAAEAFGERGTRPGRQIGLRYEIDEGLKLTAAIGRADGARLASLGLAWEF